MPLYAPDVDFEMPASLVLELEGAVTERLEVVDVGSEVVNVGRDPFNVRPDVDVLRGPLVSIATTVTTITITTTRTDKLAQTRLLTFFIGADFTLTTS